MGRSRRRRLLLVGIFLALLVLLAAGAFYVFKVARGRTGPMQQAAAALRAGDEATAERLLRDLLDAKPDDIRARATLIRILEQSGRLDEAADLARFWLDDPETEPLAFRALGGLSLRRLDLAGAERWARMLGEHDAVAAQHLLLQAADMRGTPESRMRAAEAAESLAELLEVLEARGAAWLLAAETIGDLARSLGRRTEGEPPEALVQKARRAAEEAREAFLASPALSASGPTAIVSAERLPFVEAGLARVDLLVGDAEATEAALVRLATFVENHPEAQAERASLARHLLGRGDVEAARAHAERLGEGPTVPFLRAVGWFVEADERPVALALLEGAREHHGPLLELVHARLLLAGSEAEREEGAAALETLVDAHPADLGLRLDACRRLRAAGEKARAARLLDGHEAKSDDERLSLALVALSAAREDGDEDAVAAALPRVAAVVRTGALGSVVEALRRLEEGGSGLALSLLDALEARSSVPGHALRFLRAAVLLGDPTAEGGGAARMEAAKAALEDLAADPEAPGALLLEAARRAVEALLPETSGRLLGEAFLRADPATDPAEPFVRALGLSPEVREEVVRGVAKAARGSAAHGDWLQGLAGALASGDASALVRVPAADAASAPQPSETLLQLHFALAGGDLEAAERFARALLEGWPDAPGGAERLGEVLLRSGKPEAVLTLHAEDATWTNAARVQRIRALERLDRDEEALAETRRLVVASGGSAQGLYELARALRRLDPDAAYAVLAGLPSNLRLNPLEIAPLARRIDLLRGALLQAREKPEAAERLYTRLLAVEAGLRRQLHREASGLTPRLAAVLDSLSWQRGFVLWEALRQVSATLGRTPEFLDRVTAEIEQKGLPPGVRANLLRTRAQAREGRELYRAALDDYRGVLAVLPDDLVALNNAAWLIAERIRWMGAERAERLVEAETFAERASALAPGSEQVHHTHAKVQAAAGKMPEALESLKRALDLLDEKTAALPPVSAASGEDAPGTDLRARHARYLLDRARLLEEAGEVEALRGAYVEVIERYPEAPEAALARRDLDRLGS